MIWSDESWSQPWSQANSHQHQSHDQYWSSDWSSNQSSSAWGWQKNKRQAEQDWVQSTPKKQKPHQEDPKWDQLGSPTGFQCSRDSSVDKNLPPTFTPDEDHYDKHEIWGKKLPRKVLTTQWSRTNGLAGRDLLKVTLPELLYMGWQNHGLRYLGQGWFTGAALTRNIRESVLVEKILKHVRQKGIDIDAAALNAAQTAGHQVSPNMTNAERANLIDIMAQQILAPLQTNKEVENQMTDLRRQLEEAQQKLAQVQRGQGPTLPAQEDQEEDNPKSPLADSSVRKSTNEDKPPGGKKPPKEKMTKTQAAKSKGKDNKLPPVATSPKTLAEILTHEPEETQKVLGKFPMNTATPQGVVKWLQSLPLKAKVRAKLQDSFKTVNATLKEMTKDQISALPDVVSKYGCTVRLAGQMADQTLVKVLLVAIELLE